MVELFQRDYGNTPKTELLIIIYKIVKKSINQVKAKAQIVWWTTNTEREIGWCVV